MKQERFNNKCDNLVPAGGAYVDTTHNSKGTYGYYWSANLWSSPTYASLITFRSNSVSTTSGQSRYVGISVRPVR